MNKLTFLRNGKSGRRLKKDSGPATAVCIGMGGAGNGPALRIRWEDSAEVEGIILIDDDGTLERLHKAVAFAISERVLSREAKAILDKPFVPVPDWALKPSWHKGPWTEVDPRLYGEFKLRNWDTRTFRVAPGWLSLICTDGELVIQCRVGDDPDWLDFVREEQDRIVSLLI